MNLDTGQVVRIFEINTSLACIEHQRHDRRPDVDTQCFKSRVDALVAGNETPRILINRRGA